MSGLSHSYTGGLEWTPSHLVKRLKDSLVGFFKTKEISRVAKIFHGAFSYELVPDTAIRDFTNMNGVTSIQSGDFYVCVFEAPRYQGQYRIIGPGEKVEVGICGSVIVSTGTFSVDAVRENASPPAGFWELSGPMYLFHFFSGYRCA